MKRITKKEKRLVGSFLLGVLAWSLLGNPLDKILSSIIPNTFAKIIVGLIIGGLAVYIFKL